MTPLAESIARLRDCKRVTEQRLVSAVQEALAEFQRTTGVSVVGVEVYMIDTSTFVDRDTRMVVSHVCLNLAPL